MLDCPHCHKPTIPMWKKGNTCSACQGKYGTNMRLIFPVGLLYGFVLSQAIGTEKQWVYISAATLLFGMICFKNQVSRK